MATQEPPEMPASLVGGPFRWFRARREPTLPGYKVIRVQRSAPPDSRGGLGESWFVFVMMREDYGRL